MRPDFEKGNGLVPAIIQDYHTKEVLMLAYVNEEAYETPTPTPPPPKPETSGHFQYIKGMYLDCDEDTLLIYVEQIGAACHTGTYSCFFNEIMPYQNLDIFHELYDLIEDRKVHPVEKSYTNYLFEQGIDKICKKVGEEASETIIAAKNSDNEELIGEISDLFYHVYVLMANQNITVEDIEKKLGERHQITGNKKDFHQRGEY